MKKIVIVIVVAVLSCAIPALMGAEGKEKAKSGGKAESGEVSDVLSAVDKILRGEHVSQADLKSLDKAVIRLETTGMEQGVKINRGVETAPGEGVNIQKNVYILRFDTRGGGESQLHVLKLQREILKNQLFLLKTLSTMTKHQVMLATRTARVDSRVRDMTMGMKSSQKEMKRVRGETASTGAKVTDVELTTMDMAECLEGVAKNIEDIEGVIGGVEMMIDDMSGDMK